LQVLNDLASVITIANDDTLANKIRFLIKFLIKAIARLNVDIAPIALLQFTFPATFNAFATFITFPFNSLILQLSLIGLSNYAARMQAIINKHNFNSKELSNLPPFKAFAATSARATRGATATVTITATIIATIAAAIITTITIAITTATITTTAAAIAFKLTPQIALT
jgi:hypothetical protein